jgi:hypothetical protein
MQYRLERGRECRYANGLGILELDGKRCELKNRKKDRTFAARKMMGPDHHQVFMYTPDLSVSNQKEQREREKIHTVRSAGLKPRRSLSYTIITKTSCFDVLLLFALLVITNLT